jgi:hypothetical protein
VGKGIQSESKDLNGERRAKLSAAPTTQWRSKLSPRKVSAKREYFADGLETLGRFSSKLPDFGAWRLIQNARNPLEMQGFPVQIDHNRRSSDCVAALEGIELRHSKRLTTFEMSREFGLESLTFGPGDFSAFSRRKWEPGDSPRKG